MQFSIINSKLKKVQANSAQAPLIVTPPGLAFNLVMSVLDASDIKRLALVSMLPLCFEALVFTFAGPNTRLVVVVGVLVTSELTSGVDHVFHV